MTGRDGARDFDFLLGSWAVRHRRLKQRLTGDARREEFGGTMHACAILAGRGNFDENVIALPAGGYQACTLRISNPAARHWSIHWIDGRDPRLDPPMIGSFVDGVGTFFGDDRLDGRSRSASCGPKSRRRARDGSRPSRPMTGSAGRRTG